MERGCSARPTFFGGVRGRKIVRPCGRGASGALGDDDVGCVRFILVRELTCVAEGGFEDWNVLVFAFAGVDKGVRVAQCTLLQHLFNHQNFL